MSWNYVFVVCFAVVFVGFIIFMIHRYLLITEELTKILERLAFKYHGHVIPGDSRDYPQLVFSYEGIHYRVIFPNPDTTESDRLGTIVVVKFPYGHTIEKFNARVLSTRSTLIEADPNTITIRHLNELKTYEKLNRLINKAVQIAREAAIAPPMASAE